MKCGDCANATTSVHRTEQRASCPRPKKDDPGGGPRNLVQWARQGSTPHWTAKPTACVIAEPSRETRAQRSCSTAWRAVPAGARQDHEDAGRSDDLGLPVVVKPQTQERPRRSSRLENRTPGSPFQYAAQEAAASWRRSSRHAGRVLVVGRAGRRQRGEADSSSRAAASRRGADRARNQDPNAPRGTGNS